MTSVQSEHESRLRGTASEVRSVFLSCLGIGNYHALAYAPPDGEPEIADPVATRFIQLARLKALKSRGIEIHASYILVTEDCDGSRVKNWNDDGHTGKCSGLASSLRTEGLAAKPVSIPSGTNQSEFWDIFRIVSELVPPSADLYVDLTHGFRTLPILVLMALEFVSKVNGARIVELTYGAANTAGENTSGSTWNLEPFLVIRDWADAVSSFVNYGDTRPLAAVAHKPTKELGRILQRNMPKSLGCLNGGLTTFGEAISKCYSPGIPRAAVTLKKQVASLIATEMDHGPLQPLVQLLRQVQAKLKHFPEEIETDQDFLKAQWAAAEWCFHHNRAMQGVTFLREGIVTALMMAWSCSLSEADERFGVLAFRNSPTAADVPEVEVDFLESPPLPEPIWSELCKMLSKLTATRNKLNHAYNGHPDRSPISKHELEQQGTEFLGVFSKVIEALGACAPEYPTSTV